MLTPKSKLRDFNVYDGISFVSFKILFIKQKEGTVKTLLILLLGGFLSFSVRAQILTLRFENTTNRNYEVKVDGKSYYSSNLSTEAGKQKILTLNGLQPGTHTLDVFTIDNDVNNTNAATSIYSNTFQLRTGYDMLIAIRRNEQVTFTERRSTNTATSSQTPMSEVEFDKLHKSVNSKWSQAARLTAAKTAVTSRGNYFTTEQIGQLISLITAESKKLELAKLSYPKVTDPGNFSEINTLFNSQAAREELEKYVGASTGTTTTTTAPSNGRSPMSAFEFNSLLQTVKNQYQQEGKVAVLTDAFNTGGQYYSTSQLRQLISLVTAENNRLALAKLSYARVSDIANFSSLNNLLAKQSSRDELNYFVKYGGNTVSAEQYANRVAISDAEFRKLYQKANLHFRQSSVVADVKAAFSNTTNYYSIAQVRSLLGLITTESDRLTLAKLAYHRVTEPPAFTQLFDMFTSEASKNDLSNYISSVAINQ